MVNDKRRSIGVFIFICIVLLFVIIGGIRFVKNREITVAHNSSAPVIEAPKQEVEHKEPAKDSPPVPTASPAPSTPSPTKPNTPAPTTVAPPTNQTPAQVPATGPSYLDFGLTGVLIMLTAYFAASLRNTRNTIKRMVLRY